MQVNDDRSGLSRRTRLLAMLLLGATICGIGCNGRFDVELQQSVASPDGRLIADCYVEYGGGGPGWSASFVRIRPSSEHFRTGTDYIFEADAHSLGVKWVDNDHLELSWTPDGLPILKHDSKWRNVQIAYVSKGDFR
jgi:hypothetical protein